MVELLDEGEYQLLETKGEIKILILAEAAYAWVDLEGSGEILVTAHRLGETEAALSLGRFKLYQVENEPQLSDQQHLELSVGEGAWQGYLLPTGLPRGMKIRGRIVPTKEIISPLKVA